MHDDIELVPDLPPTDNFCWVCQESIETGGLNRTHINSDISLPIHKRCWLSVPPGDRANIAFKASIEMGPLGLTKHEALDALATALSRNNDGMDFPFRQN